MVGFGYVVGVAVSVIVLVGFAVKFVLSLARMVALWDEIAQQFRPNHGTSLVDRVEKIERLLESNSDVVALLRRKRES